MKKNKNTIELEEIEKRIKEKTEDFCYFAKHMAKGLEPDECQIISTIPQNEKDIKENPFQKEGYDFIIGYSCVLFVKKKSK